MWALLLQELKMTGRASFSRPFQRHAIIISFLADKQGRVSGDKIPCAFVVTGPNLTSQDLLFEQLEETLVASEGNNKFVRLRSADASNMKAVLRKIIQDITCKASDDDDGQLTVGKSVSISASLAPGDFEIC